MRARGGGAATEAVDDRLRAELSRVLIVDDEAPSRELLEAMVEGLGHRVEKAAGGEEALERVGPGVDLVLLDVLMRGLDGFETARRIRERFDARELPIVMVTALDSKRDRIRAVEAGANDFVSKPVDRAELKVRLDSQLALKEAWDRISRHSEELERQVADRTRELRRALEEMVQAERQTRRAHIETVERLMMAAEYRDDDTGVHIKRISAFCALLGRAAGLPEEEVEMLRLASPMHDIGKLGIPDAVLLKPGKLTPEERQIIQRHTVIGARILRGSTSAILQAGELIARTHHEKWDGTGYPAGLAGEDIPLFGRICAVADVFDALMSDRPYRKALSLDETLGLMRPERGKQFQPELLDVLLDGLDEAMAIRERYADLDGSDVFRLDEA